MEVVVVVVGVMEMEVVVERDVEVLALRQK